MPLPSPAFSPNKQAPLNPRNTSYDYIERPGESLLDDANEDIVERWLKESGVNMPHHRDSAYHERHGKNARVGVPDARTSVSMGAGSRPTSSRRRAGGSVHERREGREGREKDASSSRSRRDTKDSGSMGPYERSSEVSWVKST
jgi:hypothetical protein